MSSEKDAWLEERVNEIMPLVEYRPEIMPLQKDYAVLVAHSTEVPREQRQKALLHPVTFAHDMLLNLVSCIAFDEQQLGLGKHLEHELIARINEDLKTEIALITYREKTHGGREH